jgi:hypothetical protein
VEITLINSWNSIKEKHRKRNKRRKKRTKDTLEKKTLHGKQAGSINFPD